MIHRSTGGVPLTLKCNLGVENAANSILVSTIFEMKMVPLQECSEHTLMTPSLQVKVTGSMLDSQTEEKRFPYRKWRIGSGEFCGITYHQDPKTFEITYHQRDYAQHLRPILLSKERLKDKEAKQLIRKYLPWEPINGAANWLSSQSRPDLCAQTSFSQQCFPEPRVKHLLYANQLVHRANSIVMLKLPSSIYPGKNLAFVSTAMQVSVMPRATVVKLATLLPSVAMRWNRISHLPGVLSLGSLWSYPELSHRPLELNPKYSV